MGINCSNCNKPVHWGGKYYDTGKGIQILLCKDCKSKEKELIPKITKQWEEIDGKTLEELMANPNIPKIKCPYCEKWFPRVKGEQYSVSAETNVIKYFIAPEFGLAGSLKNKPFIQCPHCKMKIMQG